MGITAQAPDRGIVAEVGGRSRPLLLRNGEIERFEAQHDFSVFSVYRSLADNTCQVRFIRAIVALALVGGGERDAMADQLVAAEPPHRNFQLREMARDVIAAAFAPEQKKSDIPAGSQAENTQTATTP